MRWIVTFVIGVFAIAYWADVAMPEALGGTFRSTVLGLCIILMIAGPIAGFLQPIAEFFEQRRNRPKD